MLKSLDELSNDELKVEFVKAGLEGDDDKAQMVIRMTIYLVKVLRMDPFSFKFEINEETMESAAGSSSWLADGSSVETGLVSSQGTLSVRVGSSLDLSDEYLVSSSSLSVDFEFEPIIDGSTFVSFSSPSSSFKVPRDVSLSSCDTNEETEESSVSSSWFADGSSEETVLVALPGTLSLKVISSLNSKFECSELSSSMVADTVSAVRNTSEYTFVESSFLLSTKGRLLDMQNVKPVVWPPDLRFSGID